MIHTLQVYIYPQNTEISFGLGHTSLMVCVTGHQANDLPVTRQQIVESLWGARETHPGKPESNTEAGGTYHKLVLVTHNPLPSPTSRSKENPKGQIQTARRIH